jgi:redox-sensitive bicupin YhaK (pirin superfamily)
VGDGFPVRNLFSYDTQGVELLSPFLLLDFAAATKFAPSARPRGVGEHPHRGFETVTIVYQGELAHRDSAGNAGLIGPGDVQWMTAASGILHEEFHSPDFSRNGGELEMAQLWVNLPARHKMSAPRYQTLLDADIPRVDLAGGAGSVRVIAGDISGQHGPAATFSPLNVWDVRLNAGRTARFAIPQGHSTAIAVLRGALQLDDGRRAGAAQLLVFGRDGDELEVHADGDATLLLLSGAPIPEPVVGHGPFVMNSRQEIETALADFQRGKFGRMPARSAPAELLT